MHALIKRSLITVPTIALAGLVAAGMAMADSKGDHGGWGEMGDKYFHHSCDLKESHGGDEKGHGHKYGKKGGNRGDMVVRYMSKVLDLTDAQQGAIKDIMKGQHEGMSGGHQSMSAQLADLAQLDSGSDAYIAKAKEIGALQGEAMGQRLIDQANMEAQVLSVLTPEQVEKFQVMHDEMTEKRAEHMQNHDKKGDHSN
jgi:Spy/CpxP family protein refolding chaperone